MSLMWNVSVPSTKVMSHFQLVLTFAVTGSVGYHLQAVQEGREARHGGEDLTLESVAFCHQSLE